MKPYDQLVETLRKYQFSNPDPTVEDIIFDELRLLESDLHGYCEWEEYRLREFWLGMAVGACK